MDRLKQGLADYKELVQIVSEFEGTLQELCDKLDGYNLEDTYFDCNYKSITATIDIADEQIGIEASRTIDIWDDKNSILLEEQISIDELEAKIYEENRNNK